MCVGGGGGYMSQRRPGIHQSVYIIISKEGRSTLDYISKDIWTCGKLGWWWCWWKVGGGVGGGRGVAETQWVLAFCWKVASTSGRPFTPPLGVPGQGVDPTGAASHTQAQEERP